MRSRSRQRDADIAGCGRRRERGQLANLHLDRESPATGASRFSIGAPPRRQIDDLWERPGRGRRSAPCRGRGRAHTRGAARRSLPQRASHVPAARLNSRMRVRAQRPNAPDCELVCRDGHAKTASVPGVDAPAGLKLKRRRGADLDRFRRGVEWAGIDSRDVRMNAELDAAEVMLFELFGGGADREIDAARAAVACEHAVAVCQSRRTLCVRQPSGCWTNWMATMQAERLAARKRAIATRPAAPWAPPPPACDRRWTAPAGWQRRTDDDT